MSPDPLEEVPKQSGWDGNLNPSFGIRLTKRERKDKTENMHRK